MPSGSVHRYHLRLGFEVSVTTHLTVQLPVRWHRFFQSNLRLASRWIGQFGACFKYATSIQLWIFTYTFVANVNKVHAASSSNEKRDEWAPWRMRQQCEQEWLHCVCNIRVKSHRLHLYSYQRITLNSSQLQPPIAITLKQFKSVNLFLQTQRLSTHPPVGRYIECNRSMQAIYFWQLSYSSQTNLRCCCDRQGCCRCFLLNKYQ